MQSRLAFSRMLRRAPTGLVYMALVRSASSPRYWAMAAISSSLTQTYPAAPVQQWPQRVQRKRRPSRYQGSADMPVSIVIPALNEAACLPDALKQVRRQRPHEIIVVDGGSTDGTIETASAADIVLTAPRGRASQMNAGAARAGGD